METSVFSTILVNSSKLILPSRSRSASIMVLSTIWRSCQRRSSQKVTSIMSVWCNVRWAKGSTTHLLQLLILQIAPHHHLQHNKQLSIADVPIAINIIDPECKPQLLFLIAFAAEGAEPGNEFLEIDVAAAIFVEYGDHACCEGVRGDLGKCKEFVALDCAGVVLVWGLELDVIGRGGERRRTLSSFMKRFRRRSTSSRSTVHFRQPCFYSCTKPRGVTVRRTWRTYNSNPRLCCRAVRRTDFPSWLFFCGNRE